MTFAEFEKADKKALRKRVLVSFDKYSKNPYAEMGSLLEAQFYMAELDRRHDSWTSVRDLILEIIVIALIGGEIWLGWKQDKDEGILMDKQNAVLEKLNKSMAATADTVRLSLGTMQAMNTAIRAQVDRASSILTYIQVDPPRHTIDVVSQGNVDFVIHSIKVGPLRGIQYSPPIPVRHGKSATIRLDALFTVLGRAQNGRQVSVPLVFLVRDDIGNEVVMESSMSASRNVSGVLEISLGNVEVRQREWSKEVGQH